MTSERQRKDQRDGVGEKEKSVICECLVQLSVVAWLLTSINNSLPGIQRGRENERRGKREYTAVPQGQTLVGPILWDNM